jgi:hypothetical protein
MTLTTYIKKSKALTKRLHQCCGSGSELIRIILPDPHPQKKLMDSDPVPTFKVYYLLFVVWNGRDTVNILNTVFYFSPAQPEKKRPSAGPQLAPTARSCSLPD